MKKRVLLIVASLLFSGMMFAQDFHWTWTDADVHDYQTNMHITGRAYLDGTLVTDRGDIEVATFVGDELRGTKMLVAPYPASSLGYFVWTNCFYTTEGETFTFKAFDHASGLEYDLCPTQLVGQQNGHGSIDEPIEMYFTRTEQPTYGPEYPWIPSNAYFGEGMTVTAQIQINGQHVDRATYEVGAFCGDECRGNSKGDNNSDLDDWTDLDLGYFAFMNVRGNNGDIINFYLYDKESSQIFPGVCSTTLELINGTEIGMDIFGGDIFVLNFVTEQTFTKDILGYEVNEGDGHYYLIASPIGEVAPSDVTNMLSNAFDLYYFDQAKEKEWINYKPGEGSTDANFNLVSGKGYLYANSQDVTLSFTGFPYSGDGEFPLEYTDGCNFSGWNLVGNPFAKTAYIDGEYYVMGTDGNIIAAMNPNVGIPAMEGCFVVATAPEQTVQFLTTAPNATKATLALNLSNGRYVVDRAIVRFGEGQQLPKFQLNSNSSKLYMPVEGNNYAVVYSGNVGEVPVSFKAAENGNYTVVLNTENVTFNYLHLIDNLTGADVDLLQNSSYNFNAKTTDYANRFKLVFATGVNDDDTFGFYSNGSWIINNDGDAILQVVDVTGRIMNNEEIHGCYSKRIEAAPGVYMLRLVKGSDVKVQKIVVE